MDKNLELKQVGLKVTGPRLKIYELFINSPGAHWTADKVHQMLLEAGGEVGLATVYRVLTQFAEADLLLKHSFESESAIYELNPGEHHDHLVCLKCDTVLEFVDPLIEERQQTIAANRNFQILNHSMVLYGLCEHCA